MKTLTEQEEHVSERSLLRLEEAAEIHYSIVHWTACVNIEAVTGNGKNLCCHNFRSGYIGSS